MKNWIKTGFYSVGIYLIIFSFNYFFLRSTESYLILSIVTAPVYFLLQLFGVVEPGIYFIAGIFFYFFLGAMLSIISDFIVFVWSKLFAE